MNSGDSIAAIATPPGRGGVGIVRISGPLSSKVARIMTGRQLSPRHAYFGPFLDQDSRVIDEGLAIYFQSPQSYTGEDVLELQGHGGPVVLDMILRRVLELGCRIAKPGEFTERAFLNDKIDLAQAEAVSDLIESGSVHAAKAALLSLQGVLSDKIHHLRRQLVDVRVYIESALDFAEEEIDFLSDLELQQRLQDLQRSFKEIESQAKQGRLLKEGMRVVIAGKPNVGKSSLLNALTGNDSAIVTDVPGTTRDILSEQIHIDGMPLHVIDTAGLRESEDPVEKEGMRRAHAQIKAADRVLLVLDSDKDPVHRPLWVDAQIPVVFVINKIDLSHNEASFRQLEQGVCIGLSAKTGLGISLLKSHLKDTMGFESDTEGTFIARRRHLDALRRAKQCVDRGLDQLRTAGAGELCAEEMRYAQEAINEITGEFSSHDLLGEIFERFCIGK